jgi:hypothetical protein
LKLRKAVHAKHSAQHEALHQQRSTIEAISSLMQKHNLSSTFDWLRLPDPEDDKNKDTEHLLNHWTIKAFNAMCSTPGMAAFPSLPIGNKWLLYATSNRGTCYEADSLAELCGCNGDFPYPPTELLANVAGNFALDNSGKTCTDKGFCMEGQTNPLITEKLVDTKCKAKKYETSLRKFFGLWRRGFQKYLLGELTLKEAGQQAFGPHHMNVSSGLQVQTMTDMYYQLYCGTEVPCGPDGIMSEWVNVAYCMINPDYAVVLDTVSPRLKTGINPKDKHGNYMLISGFYEWTRNPVDDSWFIQDIVPQGYRTVPDDGSVSNYIRCNTAIDGTCAKDGSLPANLEETGTTEGH